MSLADHKFETVLIEQIDNIARITLNRPERRNAISATLLRELVSAVELSADDESVNVVIIRGAGPSFCAGYDLGTSDKNDTYGARKTVSLPRSALNMVAMMKKWSQIWSAPVPVIAQVHGHCLAGGTDLAQHCDLIIAAEDATFGFPALRMGGTPPTNMWIYNVGPQWAKRLLFTGDTFTGRFAAKIGFALEAVPAEKLEDHVLNTARRIAAMGRDIVGVNKHVVNMALEMMGRTSLQGLSAPLDTIANQAPEHAAFMERSREIGLGPAFKERDAQFAGGGPIDVTD
jgi:enoyl-CoA hydratase